MFIIDIALSYKSHFETCTSNVQATKQQSDYNDPPGVGVSTSSGTKPHHNKFDNKLYRLEEDR